MNDFIKKSSQKNISYFLDVLSIVLGIIGVVGGLYYSLCFPEPWFLYIGISVAFGLILTYLYYIQNHKHIFVLLISCFLMILLVLFLYQFETESIMNQLKTIVLQDYFLRFDEIFKNVQMTEGLFPIAFFSIIAIPLIYLIVSTVCQKRLTLLKLFILIVAFIFPVLIRHQLAIYTSYCFIIFIFYTYVFGYILKYQPYQIPLKCLFVLGITALLLVSHIFLESNPIFKQSSSSVLTQINHWFDNSPLDDFFHSPNTTGMNSSVNGNLPTGNITLDNSVALTVRSQQPFSSYLRGYSLAHYSDNRWNPIRQNFEDVNSLQFFPDYLKRNYFVEQSTQVQIETKKSTSYQFVPYYSMLNQNLVADSYYTKKDVPIKTIIVDSKQLSNYQFGEELTTTNAYQTFVKEEYLEVPANLKERLMQYINEQSLQDGYGFDSLKTVENRLELADYVRTLLSRTTTYNLQAGNLPDDKDFIEYFLFENKKGSCTHYASTGALMLRCLGVPTRYVNGFVMEASDFKEGVAQIQNARSHAWVEVYISQRGWVPVEMTPAETIEQQAEVLDQFLQNQDQAKPDQNNQTPTTQPEDETPTNTPSDTDQLTHKGQQISWYESILEYSQYIIAGLSGLALVVLYRLLTTKTFYFQLRRHQSLNQKIIFYYRRIQKIQCYNHTVPSIIEKLANKAKFSQYQISEQELLEFVESYQSYVKTTYQTLPLYRRFIFKYIKGYL